MNYYSYPLLSKYQWSLLAYAVVTFLLVFPDAAFATSNNAIETVFCNVIGLFTGGTGKAISTVGIIAVGIGALLGKTSWGMGFIVMTGVALIFGASSVVNVMTGNGGAGFCSGIGGYYGGYGISLSVSLGVPDGASNSVPDEIASPENNG